MTDTDVRPLATPPADAAPGTAGGPAPAGTLALVLRLSAALAAADVTYCHWKSNEAMHRSLSGDNDLDLLVARADQHAFVEVLARLGFRRAALPPTREAPAVVHYYGLDAESGRLVHVHAHFRLILGDDATKNFWLPIEGAYLASRSRDDVLPVPAPALELAVLVLRMVLKHSTWDAMLQRRGSLSASEKREVEWLLARTTWAEAEAAVSEHLPFLTGVWPACRAAVARTASRGARARTAERLARALAGCARRPWVLDTPLRAVRRPARMVRGRVLRNRPVRKHLVHGGAVVAVVGGDGSGKTTAVEGLSAWLSRTFVVRRVHIGRPPRSATSAVVKTALRAGHRAGLFPELASPSTTPGDPRRAPSTAWLLWHVLTARDRHLLYTRARRVAANGGIVVCDRYPLPQLRTMDGPRTAWARELPGLSRLSAALIDREARYYGRFARPDVLAVLRVDPEVAVRRKTEEEESYVRARSSEVWRASWDEATEVIDAGRPADEVLGRLKAAVWARL